MLRQDKGIFNKRLNVFKEIIFPQAEKLKYHLLKTKGCAKAQPLKIMNLPLKLVPEELGGYFIATNSSRRGGIVGIQVFFG